MRCDVDARLSGKALWISQRMEVCLSTSFLHLFCKGCIGLYRHVLKTIVPHCLTLFFVSGCPDTNVTYWWLSLGLYRSSVAISQLLLDSGFTSFFDTKQGNIGIKNSALKPHELASKISSNVEMALNLLSLVRHCHFALLVAPWLMVPLLCANIYGMAKSLMQQGRKHLQLTLKL